MTLFMRFPTSATLWTMTLRIPVCWGYDMVFAKECMISLLSRAINAQSKRRSGCTRSEGNIFFLGIESNCQTVFAVCRGQLRAGLSVGVPTVEPTLLILGDSAQGCDSTTGVTLARVRAGSNSVSDSMGSSSLSSLSLMPSKLQSSRPGGRGS